MRLSQQDQRNRLYIHNFFTIIVEWRKSFRFLDTIYLRGSIGPMMSRSVERKMRYSLSPPLLCLAPTPALVNIKDKSRQHYVKLFHLDHQISMPRLTLDCFIVQQALSSNLHIANNKIIDKIVAHKHFTMDCSLPYQCADAGGRYQKKFRYRKLTRYLWLLAIKTCLNTTNTLWCCQVFESRKRLQNCICPSVCP